jgi:hypothetical protein
LFELCFEIERSLRIVSVDGKALEREREKELLMDYIGNPKKWKGMKSQARQKAL